jgi:hypothetical protein
MGRSFDRGGQNRKERERGKRRNFRQSERDREARDAVMQAKRTAAVTAFADNRRLRASASATMVAMQEMQPKQPKIPVAIIEQKQKRPGFFAQVINRFFKKSA